MMQNSALFLIINLSLCLKLRRGVSLGNLAPIINALLIKLYPNFTIFATNLKRMILKSENIKENNWDVVIKPSKGLLDVPVKKILDYSDLLWLFVRRDLLVVYKQTILGPLWFFIQPILTTLMFVVVFGSIADIPTDGIPRPLFYLSGIVFWNYFSDCFVKTSNTFTHNADIFGKVYFPRLIMPLSIIFSNGLKFLIQFSLFLLVYFYYGATTGTFLATTAIFIVPLLFLLMAMIGLGFGLIFSSLTTKYKDLNFLIQFGVQLLMYATPVIYPISILSNQLKSLIWFNPLSHILEAFKFAFLGQGCFSWLGIAYSALCAIFFFMLGVIIFNKTEQSFMDTV